MLEQTIRDTVISSFVAIFSKLQANILLRTAFTECKEIKKKHDCIREVLNAVKENTELFIPRLEAIIELHTNVIKKDLKIIKKINRALVPLSVKYDKKAEQIKSVDSFTSILFDRKEKYIQIEDTFIPNPFYKRLIQEINACYYSNTYTSTMVMIRKLFENLLIDILRKRYKNDSNKTHLYWKGRYFERYAKLITNLKKNIGDFMQYSTKMDNDLITFLDDFIRLPANASAHTIENLIERNELESKMQKINYYCDLLFSILVKI
ncbi:MAG: hypothetical protein ACTSYH_15115 [Candidatus Heimdallarchaeaceae archaeon]